MKVVLTPYFLSKEQKKGVSTVDSLGLDLLRKESSWLG